MAVKIYHNPRCSKSRQTLQLLQENGVEPEVVEYLKTPPNSEELTRILTMLGMAPRELMRKGEAVYKDEGLADEGLTDEDLIQAMVDHPILIERPIVVVDDSRAAVGRPPESVLAVL